MFIKKHSSCPCISATNFLNDPRTASSRSFPRHLHRTLANLERWHESSFMMCLIMAICEKINVLIYTFSLELGTS